jgi:hypothetical protein
MLQNEDNSHSASPRSTPAALAASESLARA